MNDYSEEIRKELGENNASDTLEGKEALDYLLSQFG
jgi:hypothetical protein